MDPWQVDERDFSRAGDERERLIFLLRYAVLAPSSHNTQPWRFAVDPPRIRLYADKTRWLQVADSDQRELHVSLGCALENLLVAAEHFGYGREVAYLPDPADADLVAVVDLAPDAEAPDPRPDDLFDAIPARHTNHNAYDGRPLPADARARLEDGAEEGILLHLTEDPAIKRQVDEMTVEADARQFADPAWREELAHWLGQGVFGTPWFMAKVSQLAVTYLNLGKGTGKKDSELLMSAPTLGVISSPVDDRTAQIKAGQVFERLALTATALGIRVHPMSQILEFDDLKAQVADLIPVEGAVPQHTFRLGYAPAEDHTPRRPLSAVLCGGDAC